MNTQLQLTPTEYQMMQEVFAVMQKYPADTRKFGLQLVHSHFEMRSDEILYETHDKNARTLSITPVPADAVKGVALATSWQLDKSGGIEVAMFCCDIDDGGRGGQDTGK